MDEPTAFLQQVELKRFKAALDPAPIPLRPFTVVVGRNGSGKSTLVEALQWLDTAQRRSASEACDRYRGIRDLIHRSATRDRNFEIGLSWQPWQAEGSAALRYRMRCGERNGAANPVPLPAIQSEELFEETQAAEGTPRKSLVTTSGGSRQIFQPNTQEPIVFDNPERLAWPLGSSKDPAFEFLQQYWARAVFLRLSPSQLAKDSPSHRSGIAPLLDEEGKMLPALLLELDHERRIELAELLATILPDVREIRVNEPDRSGETYYSLIERPSESEKPATNEMDIPAWMLSEGTRRLTAIFALLLHDPPPSLLCIEEIENGLDPWTLIKVLGHLEAASRRGTQVILTTHSVWLLDECPLESILYVERKGGETDYQPFLDRAGIRSFKASIPAGTRFVYEQP